MHIERSLLPKYFSILEGNRPAQYLECKQIPVSFDTSAPTNTLWEIHETALQQPNQLMTNPHQSLLDLKIELANRIYHACCFCEHRCGVDRESTTGRCRVGESRIVSEFLHLGEEPLLVPSHTVFFSGCTFQCVFCQNWDISQEPCGTIMEPKTLARSISERRKQGAKNVNWVGGDPTSNLLFILRVLKESDGNIPQVWNSNMFCSTETMKLLDKVMDVYLTDFKYGNDHCAHRLSKVDRYTPVVKRNHKFAYSQGELLVRHLVMPEHESCCSQPVLQWIKQNIPEVLVNIMPQYHPEYHAADYEEIASGLRDEDFQRIKNYAENVGLHLL